MFHETMIDVKATNDKLHFFIIACYLQPSKRYFCLSDAKPCVNVQKQCALRGEDIEYLFIFSLQDALYISTKVFIAAHFQ